MSHVPKRLASTATKVATLSTSHLKVFPPPEAVVGRAPSSSQTERTPSFFSAETWATLQPPNPASLSAFAHRIGLAKTFSNPAEVIQQACTHPSFVPFHAKHNPDQPAVTANGNLTTLGNSLLGLFATEHVNSTYPHLPTRVMKAAVSAYVGASSCASIAKDMGVGHLLRWNRTVSPRYRLLYILAMPSRADDSGAFQVLVCLGCPASLALLSAYVPRSSVDQAVIGLLVWVTSFHFPSTILQPDADKSCCLVTKLDATRVFV